MQNRTNLLKGITAGLVAITINTLLLKMSALFHIKAEGGGLLKLFLKDGGSIIGHHPFFYTNLFSFLFHYLTGMVMVFIYIHWISPLSRLPGWIKGSLFSLFPWAVNGFIVLPMLGRGWLGSDVLLPVGIFYFFIANWIFGLVLGWLYDLLLKRNI